jgi:hypothetical protein
LTQIYNNTVVINNFNVNHHTVVNNGIAVGNIATATRTTIHAVPVHEIHPGIAQGNYGQPFNHFGQASGVNRSNSAGTPGTPLRNEAVAQNRLPRSNYDWHPATASQFNGVASQSRIQPAATSHSFTSSSIGSQNQNGTAQNRIGQPPVNNYASPNHNQMFASIPQRQVPMVNYPSPMAAPTLPMQTATANFHQPSSPAIMQPTGTPRAYNYHPNESQNIGVGQNENTMPAANNYVSPRNNQQANYPPQNYRSAPSHAPVSSPSHSGGNQGGNRGWPGH